MDVGVILKIVGIGILVAISGTILNKSGRDEYGMFVTIAGIVTVVLMLLGEIGTLFEDLKSVFGL